MADPARPTRRSLILAGGGTKVAFQAGVLQVWLDEAGLSFDHADGASGGVFNLAMWCQGMTGTEIADNWRRFQPLAGIEPNWGGLARLPFAPSLFKLDRFRRNVLSRWCLDWEAIRDSEREATFNLYNFSRHRHVVLTAAEMDEDRLVLAVSLPMWFPPISIDGDDYIDAVFATGANLEEAVRRGADELWVIWTVSEQRDWDAGFVTHYSQVIEACANSRLRHVLGRIERNNEAVAAGGGGEFGRHIEVKLLRAEVPVHYLLNFTRDRIVQAVELGVGAARQWCREEGVPLAPPASPADRSPPPTAVRFTEEMGGYVGLDEEDYDQGARNGQADGTRLMFHLTITVDDLDRFVADAEHEAVAHGYVSCQALGGRRKVERGAFNLLVDERDFRDKRMRYRLWFRDAAGNPLTLSGFKVVADHAGLDLWPDTTTLYARVLRGHVEAADVAGAPVVASGILRLSPLAFAIQLATFRARAPSAAARARALCRFAGLFVGKLWDVYARGPLDQRPE